MHRFCVCCAGSDILLLVMEGAARFGLQVFCFFLDRFCAVGA